MLLSIGRSFLSLCVLLVTYILSHYKNLTFDNSHTSDLFVFESGCERAEVFVFDIVLHQTCDRNGV